MKVIIFILTFVIALLPRLWIENYNMSNPIFWTVLIVWFFGNIFGFLEAMFNCDNKGV